jgi:hypothetical protein
MSVRRCQSEIDSAEFSEWVALDQMDPIGEERADLRMGILAATMVNMKHHKANARPIDFMPDFDGKRKKAEKQTKKRKQTVQEMQAALLGHTVTKA